MCACDLPRQAKAEPCAFDLAASGLVRSVKAIKDPRLLRHGNGGSPVRNGQHGALAATRKLDFNRPAWLSVFHSVGDDVLDGLAKKVGVARNHQLRRCLQARAAAGGQHLHVLERRAGERSEVDVANGERQLSRIRLREQQELA